jgi:hypothetical protein
MARVNVYLPDALYARAKRARLNVSELCQNAIDRELDRRHRLLALDGYIAALEGQLGPATAEETARGRAWAEGVVSAARRARARATSKPRTRSRKSA